MAALGSEVHALLGIIGVLGEELRTPG